MKRPDIKDYEYSDRSIYRKDLVKYLSQLEQQNKELVEELEAALDYWNQDRNDKAMFNALENYESVITDILTKLNK